MGHKKNASATRDCRLFPLFGEVSIERQDGRGVITLQRRNDGRATCGPKKMMATAKHSKGCSAMNVFTSIRPLKHTMALLQR